MMAVIFFSLGAVGYLCQGPKDGVSRLAAYGGSPSRWKFAAGAQPELLECSNDKTSSGQWAHKEDSLHIPSGR